MKRVVTAAFLSLLLLAAASIFVAHYHRQKGINPVERGARAGYVDSAECASCHARISQTFQQTGMGRSFFRPDPTHIIEDFKTRNTFFHAPSRRYYSMYERGGRYFQRRHQIGADGKPTSVVEKEIHYILGSGNHARTYLHLNAQKKLVQLPVAWYSENGGYWAMNPGYDRPDHQDFRRKISLECMFCHNAYPRAPENSDDTGDEPVFTGEIPQGIDCQRCHGPGRDHIRAAQGKDSTRDLIQKTIVNPARLSADGKLEVCMQCHLETTSTRLPYSLRRAGRSIFSYTPGEALADYMLHFDHAPGSGREDKFEIVNAAYRLRKSACFQRSGGALTCITCHNPHNIPRGEQAARHYVSVCRSCHGDLTKQLSGGGQHPSSTECLSCHMPRRRTEDVVHAVMTDHYIQRRKPARDLLAPGSERHDENGKAYQGEVVLYYPPALPRTAENELHLAVAQVKQNSNLTGGMRRLRDAIERDRPVRGEFYFELAEAYWEANMPGQAIPMYQEALNRMSAFWPAQHKLGLSYSKVEQLERAVAFLEKAAAASNDATVVNDLALAYRRMGKLGESLPVLKKAISLDPDLSQPYNNLGGVLRETGDVTGAEEAFRQAVRAQPDLAAAHANLGNLLATAGDFSQARYHFETAITQDPGYVPARLDYGLALMQNQLYAQARIQLERAVSLDPENSEAHNALADLTAMQGRIEQALVHYRKALQTRPDFAPAHFGIGSILVIQGKKREALAHFQKAAEGPDPTIRRMALEALQRVQ